MDGRSDGSDGQTDRQPASQPDLSQAREFFGGMHWCDGVNRFGASNEGEVRALDNYLHKVYTMFKGQSENLNPSI